MSEERQYYVICQDGCEFPAMTKEQILAAIQQAVESHEIADVDSGFVTTIKEQNKNTGIKFWFGTTAQFNALSTKQGNTMYILTDDDTQESIETAIEELQSAVNGFANGGKECYKAKQVTEKIGNNALSDIFESDGQTVKTATFATTSHSVMAYNKPILGSGTSKYIQLPTSGYKGIYYCEVFGSSKTFTLVITDDSQQRFDRYTDSSGDYYGVLYWGTGNATNNRQIRANCSDAGSYLTKVLFVPLDVYE